MNGLSTHILDVSRGLPAAGVAVRLEQSVEDAWRETAQAITDADGRARLREGDLEAGTYRLSFEVAAYFEAMDTPAFYPLVQVTFTVRDARHHHVPLLLSPFGFSTYRGS
jgi:5-hydroxyisourate hydrolase